MQRDEWREWLAKSDSVSWCYRKKKGSRLRATEVDDRLAAARVCEGKNFRVCEGKNFRVL